jgi:hypothetical protein
MTTIRGPKNLGKYPGFNSRKEKNFFFHHHCTQTCSVALTVSFLGIKGADYETVQSPQSKAEV